MSSEHFVSAGVLRELARDGRVNLNGLPWQRDEEKAWPIEAFGSKVLCKKHNERLSPLDDHALTFFRAFYEVEQFVLRGRPTDVTRYRLDGSSIERWMLKVLFGLAASGNLLLDGVRTEPRDPNLRDLQVVFGTATSPVGAGLYFLAEPDSKSFSYRSFGFGAIASYGTRLDFLALEVHGFRFVHSQPVISPPYGGTFLEHAIYHPRVFRFENAATGRRGQIDIQWISPGKAIDIRFPGT